MWRAYFIVGDFLACTLTGAAAAWLTQAAVPADWFVALGMAVGLVLGTLAGVLGGFLFTPLFGAFEVMLPAALSAMMAGMGAGMAQTMARGTAGIGWAEALLGGALAGLVCLAFTYLLQARLRGEAKTRSLAWRREVR